MYITKEQILDIASGGGKSKIKQMFPEVFEPEMEVGKWYKNKNGEHLFFIESIKENDLNPYQCYGFLNDGIWDDLRGRSAKMSERYRPATDKEVEEALIFEAKRIGFVEGAFMTSEWMRGSKPELNGSLFLKNYKGTLELRAMAKRDMGEYTIFRDGKWAEAIPKFTTITKAEAEDRLQDLTGQKFSIVENSTNDCCNSLASMDFSGCCPER